MQQPNVFKVLRILHTALLIGMAMFIIVSLVIVQQGIVTAAGESFQRIFQVVCVVVSAASLIGGFNIFKKRILEARNDMGPGEQRMDLYRAACILWWALIEGPGIMAVAGFIKTHNYAFFALAVFHLLCLLVFTPRKANIIVLLNLTSDEVTRLEGKA
jgi:hypothetical protein